MEEQERQLWFLTLMLFGTLFSVYAVEGAPNDPGAKLVVALYTLIGALCLIAAIVTFYKLFRNDPLTIAECKRRLKGGEE